MPGHQRRPRRTPGKGCPLRRRAGGDARSRGQLAAAGAPSPGGRPHTGTCRTVHDSPPVFSSLFAIVLGLVAGFYLLLSAPELATAAARWFPPGHRDRWARFGAGASAVLAGYLRARVLASVFVGVSYGLAFTLLGVNEPILLGVLGGVLNLVPLVGRRRLRGVLGVARKRGSNVVALDLGVDLSTPQGELVGNVIASVARWEARIIGQRTRDALLGHDAGALQVRPPDRRPRRVGPQQDAGTSRVRRSDAWFTPTGCWSRSLAAPSPWAVRLAGSGRATLVRESSACSTMFRPRSIRCRSRGAGSWRARRSCS